MKLQPANLARSGGDFNITKTRHCPVLEQWGSVCFPDIKSLYLSRLTIDVP